MQNALFGINCQRGGTNTVFQEISEIERVSKELNSVRGLNEELSGVLEYSYDGIIITDKQGTILKANKASERIFGLQESEMVKRLFYEFLDNDFSSISLIEKTCHMGHPVTSLVNTSTGCTLLVTASPVFDEKGRLGKILINVRDMTELDQLRSQLMYTKERSDQCHNELIELKNRFILEEGIVAASRQMIDLINLAMRVAKFDSRVLIHGESGVGKEVIAKLIHNNSSRAKYPFVKINCSAIPESLLESELFGFEPGSFTGASKTGKMGLFELANKGTLLLDEVGDMPYKLQVKILRVLQENEVLRIGGSKPRSINVRIISATNQDLQMLVEKGVFRPDLYFRLRVVPIRIPPLRERREDIAPIIFSLMKKLEKKYNIKKGISPAVVNILISRRWTGNIRQLENAIEQFFVTCSEPFITTRHLPPCYFQPYDNNDLPAEKEKKQEAEDRNNLPADITNNQPANDRNNRPAVEVNRLIPLKKAVTELENQLITKAMTELGNTYKAAKVLSVNQSTIWRKWQKIKGNSI